MRKLTRLAVVATFAASLTVPAIGFAQTADVSDRIRQVGSDLGFEESDVDRLTKGEIVARDLKEDSKKELALAVAMVVKAPSTKFPTGSRRAPSTEWTRRSSPTVLYPTEP